jgi:hypothetical protein
MSRTLPIVLAAFLCAPLWAGQALQPYTPPEKPVVSRAALQTIEKQFDTAIVSLDVNDPYDLLGYTRGVYLNGYGVVFSAEVNLVITPISPFRPQPEGAALVRLHDKKLGRLAVLKRVMREALVGSAALLDTVPPNEQIVIAVSLFYGGFEQRKDLPNQVVMQASRQTLLDFKAGRLSEQALQAAIKTKEL